MGVSSRLAEPVRSYYARHGRSNPLRHIVLRCPYCDTVTDAVYWSLTGTGKRCECGAVYHACRGIISADRRT